MCVVTVDASILHEKRNILRTGAKVMPRTEGRQGELCHSSAVLRATYTTFCVASDQ